MKESSICFVALCLLFAVANAYCAESPGTEANSFRNLMVYSAPFFLKNDRIITRVSVSGSKPVMFFVDNSWSRTTLNANKSRTFRFVPTSKMVFSAMHNKNMKGYVGVVPSLKIGDLVFSKPEVRISKIFNALSKGVGIRVNGVLGYSSMKQYLTTINFENDKIIFFPNSSEICRMFSEKEETDPLPFGPHPFDQKNDQIFSVLIFINDQPVDAIIDIGFNGCILTTIDPKTFESNMDKTGSKREVSVAGFNGRCFKMKKQDVRFGNKTYERVEVDYFSTGETAPVFTLLGVGFLKRFNLTFDYRNRVLYVEPILN